MKQITSLQIILLLLVPFFALSQVGIGTITPNAQLDVQASNQATPTNTDGILIPKVDEFPGTAPTAAQDGMLLFATGAGTPAKGIYYWNQNTTNWIQVVGSSNSVGKINDLADAKSDDDGTDNGSSIFFGIGAGANDNGQNNFNLGIGLNTLAANVDGQANIGIGGNSLADNLDGDQNVGLGYGTLQFNTTGFRNTALGHSVMRYTTTGIENVGVGNASMQYNRTGSYNTAVGKWSLFRNEGGIGNTTLGFFTGYNVEDGNYNTLIGYQAGAGTAVHTKSYNVFLGNRAGYNETGSHKLYIENSTSANPLIYGEFDNNVLRVNGTFQINNPTANGYVFPNIDGTASQLLQTDGSGNINWVNVSSVGAQRLNDLSDSRTTPGSLFIGNNAGASDDGTNNQSIGIGNLALQSSVNGIGNTVIGYHAGLNNVSGNFNTAMGQLAMQYNTTGGSNTAIGKSALFNNTTASQNTAIGNNTLSDTTVGGFNSAVGSYASALNISGTNNVAFGYRSLGNNTIGSRNATIGAYAGYLTMGSDNVFLGYGAGYNETGSNKLYIDNSSADANNALLYGEFDTNFLKVNGDLQVGQSAANLKLLAADANNSSLKLFEAGDFGYEFQYNGTTDKLHLWSRMFSGNEAIRMTWLKNGNVGISNTNPAYALDVTGDINTSGSIRQSGGAYSFPDYVFETYFEGTSAFNSAYKLLSLVEVEAFLKKNKHLPGVQSRADVAENGWNISENVRSNLEKIEELYLYTIEANTTIKKLSEENKNLKNQLQKVQEKIDKITTMLKKH